MAAAAGPDHRRPIVSFARSLLRSAALLMAILLAAGVLGRYTGLVDRYFIFFPDKDVYQDPGDRDLIFQDVFFEAEDGVRLHGWYVPGRGDETLVWFHGNAGNISHRVENLAELHGRLEVNIFIFDYRGYGRSEGSPTEQGTYLDARAAMAYLGEREDVDRGKLVLFGRSLGCAVALEIAASHLVYAVILESPFTSIQAMARRAYPFLPGIGLLARSKYDSLSKIKGVRSPVMVLHGDRDEIAPYEMGRNLFEAARPPKRFYTIQGAGHNDTYLVGGPEYYDALGSFIRDPSGPGN